MSLKYSHHLRHCLLLVSTFLGIHVGYSQVYTLSQTASPVNKTCYSGSLSASYTATVSPPKNYVYGTHYTINLAATTFKLRTTASGAGGTVLLTNTGGTLVGSTVSGNFNMTSLAPDVYTIYASVTVVDIPSGGTSYVLTTTTTFTIGYDLMWSEMIDMGALANASSSQRNATSSGITYSTCKSSNYLAASTAGWCEIGAQFGAASTSSLFVPLANFGVGSNYDPTAPGSNHVEFRKGGTLSTITGPGVYVKIGSIVYKLQGVVLTDRIRIQRTMVGAVGTINFYKTNSITALTGINVATPLVPAIVVSYSTITDFYVVGYGLSSGDGLQNVITSFPCREQQTIYAKLAPTLTGVNYSAFDKLFFSYDEEYAPTASTTLNYRILDWRHSTKQSSVAMAGSTLVTANRIYGDNRYELSVGTLTIGSTYILEVTNEKKEIFYLRFTKK